MKKANSSDFISILSETKPAMIMFYTSEQEEDANVKKIKQTIKAVEKKLPLLNAYEFITDEDEQNAILCENIEVTQTPILIIFKDGCFSRYKNKGFTEKSVAAFIGNKRLYEKPKEKVIEV